MNDIYKDVSNPFHELFSASASYDSIGALDDDPFFKLDLNPRTSMKADFALYKSKAKGRVASVY